MYKNRKIAAISLIPIVALLLIVTIPARAESQFVLATWDYPDEYGQGIHHISYWENSTGSWVRVARVYSYNTSNVVEWDVSLGLKLRCVTRVNYTRINVTIGDHTTAKLYQQHSIVVRSRNGTTVFTQQNFTFAGAIVEAFMMYFVSYELTMEFPFEYAEYYTATITSEIYW